MLKRILLAIVALVALTPVNGFGFNYVSTVLCTQVVDRQPVDIEDDNTFNTFDPAVIPFGVMSDLAPGKSYTWTDEIYDWHNTKIGSGSTTIVPTGNWDNVPVWYEFTNIVPGNYTAVMYVDQGRGPVVVDTKPFTMLLDGDPCRYGATVLCTGVSTDNGQSVATGIHSNNSFRRPETIVIFTTLTELYPAHIVWSLECFNSKGEKVFDKQASLDPVTFYASAPFWSELPRSMPSGKYTYKISIDFGSGAVTCEEKSFYVYVDMSPVNYVLGLP